MAASASAGVMLKCLPRSKSVSSCPPAAASAVRSSAAAVATVGDESEASAEFDESARVPLSPKKRPLAANTNPPSANQQTTRRRSERMIALSSTGGGSREGSPGSVARAPEPAGAVRRRRDMPLLGNDFDIAVRNRSVVSLEHQGTLGRLAATQVAA